MNIKYPLAKETINEEDIDALCNWLKSYPRLTKGELTLQVEKEWAKYIGTDYAVFNNSGSSANLLMIYTAIMCGKINNKKIGTGKIGPVTKDLQKSFMDVVMGKDKRFLKWLKFL